MLTTYAGDAQVLRALNAGARGYLLKGKINTELLETIRAVHAGRSEFHPRWRLSWPSMPERRR